MDTRGLCRVYATFLLTAVAPSSYRAPLTRPNYRKDHLANEVNENHLVVVLCSPDGPVRRL